VTSQNFIQKNISHVASFKHSSRLRAEETTPSILSMKAQSKTTIGKKEAVRSVRHATASVTSFNPDSVSLSQPLFLLGKKEEREPSVEIPTEPDERNAEPLFYEYLKPTISSLQRTRSQISQNTRNTRRKQSALN
jgi:hypothetical protein